MLRLLLLRHAESLTRDEAESVCVELAHGYKMYTTRDNIRKISRRVKGCRPRTRRMGWSWTEARLREVSVG